MELAVIAPKRIRLSRARGWRMPPNTVNVARPGKWGNLFVVGRDGTRLQCCAKLAILANGFIALSGPVEVDAQLTMYRRLRRSIGELRGRDVACWCSLDGPCHGDILLWLANPGIAHPLAGIEIDMPGPQLGMSVSDLETLHRNKARGEREAVPA